MRCSNCGYTARDTDRFCTKCGARLIAPKQETPKPTKPDKSDKGSILLPVIIIPAVVVLSLVLLGGLISSFVNKGTDIPEPGFRSGWVEPDSREPEWVINADLSEYDMIGEWSDGKLWVHKTEGSYDYVEGNFAYIDTDGNLIGQWHSDKEWLIPTEFCNDRALVYIGNDLEDQIPICDHGYDQKAYYAVVDENGQERFHFIASLEYQPILNIIHNTDEQRLFVNRDVHEFKENGYLFYKTKRCIWEDMDDDDPSTWPKTNILIPDEQDFIRHITLESYTDDVWNGYQMVVEYDLDCFGEEFVNGYLTYQNTYRANGATFLDYLYFDLDGNIALDVADHIDYTIQEITDVRDDLTIGVTFVGADGNSYIVDMDMNGNWLNEPVRTAD